MGRRAAKRKGRRRSARKTNESVVATANPLRSFSICFLLPNYSVFAILGIVTLFVQQVSVISHVTLGRISWLHTPTFFYFLFFTRVTRVLCIAPFAIRSFHLAAFSPATVCQRLDVSVVSPRFSFSAVGCALCASVLHFCTADWPSPA